MWNYAFFCEIRFDFTTPVFSLVEYHSFWYSQYCVNFHKTICTCLCVLSLTFLFKFVTYESIQHYSTSSYTMMHETASYTNKINWNTQTLRLWYSYTLHLWKFACMAVVSCFFLFFVSTFSHFIFLLLNYIFNIKRSCFDVKTHHYDHLYSVFYHLV